MEHAGASGVFITADQNNYLLNEFHSIANESSLLLPRNEQNNDSYYLFLRKERLLWQFFLTSMRDCPELCLKNVFLNLKEFTGLAVKTE